MVKSEIERGLRDFLEELFSDQDFFEKVKKESAFSLAIIKAEEFMNKLGPIFSGIDSKLEQEQDSIFREMKEEAKHAMTEEEKRRMRKEALSEVMAGLEAFISAIKEEKHKLKDTMLQG